MHELLQAYGDVYNVDTETAERRRRTGARASAATSRARRRCGRGSTASSRTTYEGKQEGGEVLLTAQVRKQYHENIKHLACLCYPADP